MQKKESSAANFFELAWQLALGAGLIGGMLWFAGAFSFFGVPGVLRGAESTDDFTRPHPEYVEVQQEAPAAAPPVSESWSCGWSPTMNEDWHDDVLCIKGVGSLRPSLLEDWEFVTQADMMNAAAEFEVFLNSKEGTTAEDGFRAPVFTGP